MVSIAPFPGFSGKVERMSFTVIAFDCTTRFCSAAIARDGQVLAARSRAMDRGHAEALIPVIEAVREEAGLTWADIGLIGVTVGPGTFTGVRIGLSAARGLALAGGLPVAGIVTTEAVAAQVPETERAGRTLLAVVDGRRADLFVQPFGAEGEPLAPPRAMMPAEIGAAFPGPLLLAGDGAARAGAAIAGACLARSADHVDPGSLALLAARRHRAGRGLAPVPLYFAPADVTLPGGGA